MNQSNREPRTTIQRPCRRNFKCARRTWLGVSRFPSRMHTSIVVLSMASLAGLVLCNSYQSTDQRQRGNQRCVPLCGIHFTLHTERISSLKTFTHFTSHTFVLAYSRALRLSTHNPLDYTQITSNSKPHERRTWQRARVFAE